jgi:hypothetical protein
MSDILFNFRDEPWTSTLFTLLFLSFGLLAVDFIGSYTEEVKAEIRDKTFSASTESTGVGMGFTHKGAVPVVTHSGHPDEWSVIVKVGDEYLKVNCSTTQYYRHQVGDAVKLKRRYGLISGANFWNKIVK